MTYQSQQDDVGDEEDSIRQNGVVEAGRQEVSRCGDNAGAKKRGEDMEWLDIGCSGLGKWIHKHGKMEWERGDVWSHAKGRHDTRRRNATYQKTGGPTINRHTTRARQQV